MTMGNGKMYVVVNKDLNMSIGKTAAQVAHAVARMEVGVPHTVIILEGTTWQLTGLNKYMQDNNLPHALYIDEGVNEVDPMMPTAFAFGMVAPDFTPDFIKGFKLLTPKRLFKR